MVDDLQTGKELKQAQEDCVRRGRQVKVVSVERDAASDLSKLEGTALVVLGRGALLTRRTAVDRNSASGIYVETNPVVSANQLYLDAFKFKVGQHAIDVLCAGWIRSELARARLPPRKPADRPTDRSSGESPYLVGGKDVVMHARFVLNVVKARLAFGETFCGRMRRLRTAAAEVADGLQEGLEGVSDRRGGQLLLDELPHLDGHELDSARGDSLWRRRREADVEGAEVPALADHVQCDPGRFRVVPPAGRVSERECVDGQAAFEVDGDSAHVPDG